ncbi:MAG: FAD-dependent oxidoreductase [Campylobacterota bacterium]|nr:FAD-dependent oxidoreductase [Campylobacterota bacterium]
MQKVNCDVLIIGGGPAGGVCAITAKMNYPEKNILVIREHEIQLVPCAIPYVFGETLGCTDKNIASCAAAVDMGIQTMLGKVNTIDTKNKIAYSQETEIHFDKIVLATGSMPFVHKSLEHSLALEGVFTIPKNKKLIDKAKNYIDDKKSVVIVGTGFIGVEMAIEFGLCGKDVTIIGGSKHILKGSFDNEVASRAEEILANHNVHFIGNDRVTSILDTNGDKIVNMVELKSGRTVNAEVVILATGYKPNTALAQQSGISLSHYGGIWVDEYMRTENCDILAVGDCCVRRDFITKTPSKVMLASTSAAEGRIAGSSLYGLKYMKSFSGTIAIFSTMISHHAFASAGLTEAEAKASGIDIVTGSFRGINRHPATIPGAQKQLVKLIATRHGGRIIGAQIIGGVESGEMINILGLAIENQLSLYTIMTMQIATQPMLTAAPTNYPIVMAAVLAIKEIEVGKS